MAFKGNIKFNDAEYRVRGLPTKTLANQMAPPIGQGNSKYADATSWAAWVQKNWQDGVGKLDPLETEGMLYGEVESRVPKQLILPGKLEMVNRDPAASCAAHYHPDDIAGNIGVGLDAGDPYVQPTEEYYEIAFQFTTPADHAELANHSLSFWGLVRAPLSGPVACNTGVYNDVAGSPGAAIVAGSTFTINAAEQERMGGGYYWMELGSINAISMTASTTYWFVVQGLLGSFHWAYGTEAGGPTWKGKQPLVGTWETTGLTARHPLVISELNDMMHDTGTSGQYKGSHIFRFEGNLYLVNDSRLWRFDVASDEWDLVDEITYESSPGIFDPVPAITSAVVFGTKAYLGVDNNNGHNVINDDESIDLFAPNVHLFANINGRLWRAVDNELEHSTDGTTWEPTNTYGDPITVGSPDSRITGIASLGRDILVATTQGMFQILDGDFAVPVGPWGSFSETNGVSLVEFQGALYATVNGRIIRYTSDQRIQDIWVSREDDLLNALIGEVANITRVNNWLIALVTPPIAGLTPGEEAFPSVWALQDNAWHFLALLPQGGISVTGIARDSHLYYDRSTSYLWIAMDDQTFRLHVPDYTLNPYNDSGTVYQPNAWIEWDWFDGTIFDVLKDYESVKIIGENFSATCYADVFWKDDSSTEWNTLGSATENYTELRWDVDRGDRPATRRFKLGVRLVTTDGSETPRVRAIVVKYHPMVADWYQWNLQIDISGRAGGMQEGQGSNDVNTRTGEQLFDEIEAIAFATGIYIYTDVDGKTYEVKVKGGSFSYTKQETNHNTGLVEWEGVWSLNIEQVTQGEYVAPA